MERIRIENHTFSGLWIIGWLFTVGYLHLGVQQLIMAIIIWPYYLGAALG